LFSIDFIPFLQLKKKEKLKHLIGYYKSLAGCILITPPLLKKLSRINIVKLAP